MENNYKDIWNQLHKEFRKNTNVIMKYDDWLKEYDEIINNVKGDIIDLGCGVTGNNTLFLMEKGKKVIACDFAEEAVSCIKENILGVKTLCFDMMKGLPFENNSIELIIADLSLHYFKEIDTFKILDEIYRVLIKDGHLIIRINSTNSCEYKNIIESNQDAIEKHLYYKKDMLKRFFDEADIFYFFKKFIIKSKKEESMGRYNSDKIVWNILLKRGN